MNFHNPAIEDSIKWKSTYSMAGLKIRNLLDFDVRDMVVVFAQSPLSPAIDWELVDISSKTNIDSLVDVPIGHIKSKEEKTVSCEIEYTDVKRGYWQVSFYIENSYCCIQTNKAHASPWRQDNGKMVHITLGKLKNEYLVEFIFESGSAHFLLDGLDGVQPSCKVAYDDLILDETEQNKESKPSFKLSSDDLIFKATQLNKEFKSSEFYN